MSPLSESRSSLSADRAVRRLLAVVLVMQGLTLAGQWFAPSYVAPAQAQIPDAGAQRAQMVEELRQLNGKFDRLVTLLESGKVQVRVSGADEKKDGR